MTDTRSELILLPGIDGTGTLFQWLVAALPADMAVTVVRYPKDPAFGYRDCVALARDVIGSKRVVVLGESFSGPVAVSLAAALPQQVSGLILAATFLTSPWPPVLVRHVASVNPHQAPRAARDFVLMGRYRRAEVSGAVDQIIQNLTPGLRATRLQAVAAIDVRQDFKRVRCPVLALHGRSDLMVPSRAMRRAIASKPGARFIPFAAAHMLLQTLPVEAAVAITDFIHQTRELA